MSTLTHDTETWISTSEAAELLTQRGVSTHRATINRWIETGLLDFIELPSGQKRVRLSDFVAISTPKRRNHAS